MSSLRIPVLVLFAGAVLLSCGKKEAAAPASSKPPPPVPAAQALPVQPPRPVVVAAAGAEPAPPAPAGFAYDPTGLRDPFEPFLKIEEKKKEPGPRLLSTRMPLQTYSTEQLRLVGVVWGAEGKGKALIEDPQGKGYAVSAGDLVGDRGGKVMRILPDRIVIEERFTDLFGEEKKNVANIMLHKSEGEVAR
ncbi:MAG: pilus assembly protein PilP [Deltaproteobacteria bacterium]|nr:pilus assembly protein PilP [Deltaproteobacteria bacterium]